MEFQRRLLIGRTQGRTVFATIDIDTLTPYRCSLQSHICIRSPFIAHIFTNVFIFCIISQRIWALGMLYTPIRRCVNILANKAHADVPQAPQVSDYPADAHVLANVSGHIKLRWNCAVHGTCYISSSSSEHVIINRHRLDAWGGRIVRHRLVLSSTSPNSFDSSHHVVQSVQKTPLRLIYSQSGAYSQLLLLSPQPPRKPVDEMGPTLLPLRTPLQLQPPSPSSLSRLHQRP